MDPFLVSVVVAAIAKAQGVVDVVPEEAVRIVMAGAEAEPVAVVEQRVVVLGWYYGQAESEVVARE